MNFVKSLEEVFFDFEKSQEVQSAFFVTHCISYHDVFNRLFKLKSEKEKVKTPFENLKTTGEGQKEKQKQGDFSRLTELHKEKMGIKLSILLIAIMTKLWLLFLIKCFYYVYLKENILLCAENIDKFSELMTQSHDIFKSSHKPYRMKLFFDEVRTYIQLKKESKSSKRRFY